MTVARMARPDLDHILLQLGQFGRFQALNYIAISFPIFFSALYTLTYVFTAKDLEYRCLVPECESRSLANGPAHGPGVEDFLPGWLNNAVPFEGDTPSLCERYPPIARPPNASDQCGPDDFSKSEVVRCQEWVFRAGQTHSIVSEWNITCDDQKWQLSLVGTINNIGLFCGLPFAGFISDRFGRKRLLLWSWVVTCIMGITRSFAPNLVTMLTFEFLDAFFGAGVFSAGFILGMEFVGPEKRVLSGTVLNIVYSFGQVALGGYAWGVQDWRWLLRSIYVPGLLSVLLLWPAPESVRWLASKGRYAEADDIIQRAAKFNKVVIAEGLEDHIDLMQVKAEEPQKKPKKKEKEKDKQASCFGKGSTLANLLATFKSKTLLFRFLNCAFCWMSNTFVYYGLSLNSVSMAGNEYLNFILVTLVEIPAMLVQLWMQGRFGRRFCLAVSMLLAGVSCLSFLVINEDLPWLQMTMFLVGKFAITISFAVIYVYTAEMFPTNVRHSLIGYSSGFGRIGSMLAPQTPLLARYSESLPLTLFGVFSILAAVLSLFFPETKDKSLPDTIKEAEEIGY